MDNWEFFQENLQTAMGSEGTLQNQADIFAESWAAANKRVRASWEDLFDSIINDDFFITLANGLSVLIDGFSDFVDGIGGAKGAITLLGSFFTKIFQNQIASSLEDAVHNFRTFTGMAGKEAQELKFAAAQETIRIAGGSEYEYEKKAQIARVEAQKRYMAVAKDLTEDERKQAELLFDQADALIKKTRELEEQNFIQENLVAGLKDELSLRKQADQIKLKDVKSSSQNISGESFLKNMRQVLLNINPYGEENISEGLRNDLLAILQQNKDKLIFSQTEDTTIKDLLKWLEEAKADPEAKGQLYAEILQEFYDKLKSMEFDIIPPDIDEIGEEIKKRATEAFDQQQSISFLKDIGDIVPEDLDSAGFKAYKIALDNLYESLDQTSDAAKEFFDNLQNLEKALKKGDDAGAREAIKKLSTLKSSVIKEGQQYVFKSVEDLKKFAKDSGLDPENLAILNEYIDKNMQARVEAGQSKAAVEKMTQAAVDGSNQIAKAAEKQDVTWSSVATQFVNTGFAVTNLITNFESLSALMSGDMEANATQIISMFLSIGTSIGQAATSLNTLGKSIGEIGVNAGATSGLAGKLFSTLQGGGLKTIAIMALVVAAIAAISFAIKQFYDYCHDLEIEQKNATVAVRELKEAFKATKQEAENLHNTFNQYEDVVNKLNDCTKGTKEWKDALEEVNDKTLEIISNYPELIDQLEFDENNIITEDSYKKILAEADRKAKSANLAQLNAQIYSNQVNQQVSQKEAINSIRRTLPFLDNNQIDDLLKNRNKYIRMSNDELQKVFGVKEEDIKNLPNEQKAASMTAEQWSNYTNDESFILDNVSQSFANMKSVLADLEQENNKYTKSLEKTSKVIANQVLGEDATDAQKNVASKMFQARIEAENKKLKEEFDKFNSAEELPQKIEELWKTYTEYLGVDYDLQANAIQGNDQHREIGYIDDQGEKKTVSAERMLSTIAMANAEEAIKKSQEYIDSYINTVDDTFKTYARDFIKDDFNFDFLTKEQWNSINKEGVDTALNLKELVDQSIITENDKTEIINSFTNIFSDITKDLSPKAVEAFSKVFDNSPAFDKLTIGGQKAIANIVQDAFMVNGRESSEFVANQINEILKKAKPEQVEEVSKILSNASWTSATAVEDIAKELEELGINTDGIKPSIENLVEVLKELGTSASMVANHIAYQSYQKAIQKIQSGGEFTAEDFKDVTEGGIGEEFKQYFQETVGGTFELVADSYEVIELLQNKALGNYQKTADELERGLFLAKKVEDYDRDELANWHGNIIDAAPMRLDLLEAYGQTDPKKIAEWRDSLKHGGLNLNESSDISDEYKKAYNNGLADADLERKAKSDVAISASANFSAFDKYERNLDDEEQRRNALIAASHNELKEKGLKTTAKEYENYVKILAKNNKELAENEKLLRKTAVQQIESKEGLQELADGWKDLNEKMTNTNTNEIDKALTISKVNDSLKKAFNLDQESMEALDAGAEPFAQQYWDLITQAVDGQSEEAFNKLQNIIGGKLIDANIFNGEDNLKIAAEVEINKNETQSEFQDFFTYAQSLADGYTIDFNTDTNFDDINLKFIGTCKKLLENGLITVQQLEGIFSTMDVHLEYGVEGFKELPNPAYSMVTGMNHINKDLYGGDDGLVGVEENIKVPILTIKGFSKGNNYSAPSAKDSGGSKGSAPSRQKDEDSEAKRYHEQDDALDNQKELFDDLNREMDQLYGAKRLEAMRKINKETLKENELLEDKIKRAKEFYLPKDKEKVQQAAADLGVSLEFDPETMDILNYSDVMEGLYTKLNAARKGAAAENFSTKEEQDKYIEENVTPLEEQISKLEKAIDQYDQTKELLEDLQNQIEENLDKWKDNNYQQLTYLLELRLDVSDADLEKITYFLDKLGDKYYSMAEAAGLMMDKLPDMQDKLGSNEDFYKQLQADWEAGNITDAAYYEGLKSTYSNILSELTNINNLDKEMLEYYTKAVDQANSELDKFTDGFQHMASILNHYKSVLDIMGKSTDYAKVGAILEGQASNIKNELDVATENYSNWSREAKKWEEAMQSSIRGSADWELYEKNWEAAKKAMQEAQEEMLSKTEEWAQAMRDILENTMADAARKLENALTDNTSFDQLSDSIDRAKSLQEEYLTETNKIYETDKLINKAQKDIDKTTNQVHKNKLKAFIDETNQLQQQTKLSNYELEIQQAKYELLLAEIALDEAQKAKSLVRLQRDSEGNYGYVYTADQDKVDDAEQAYEDAQNRLYNIGLRGANDYTEKYQQTLQEMYETLKDLQDQYLNGAFESEQEYQNAVEQAKDFYYQKLKDFSYLYRVALTADSRVQADAWGADFEDMTQNTEDWMTAVEDYLVEVEDAFTEWRDVVEEESTIVNDLLYDTETLVGEVTDESERLKDMVIDEVIPAIDDEIQSVGDATEAWAQQREEIANLCSQYEELIKTIQAAIAAQAELARAEAAAAASSKPSTSNSTSKPTTGSGSGSSKPTSSSGSDSGSTTTSSGGFKVGDKVTLTADRLQQDKYGSVGSVTNNKWKDKEVEIQQIQPGSKYPYHVVAPGSSGRPGWIGWVTEDQLAHLDTGGYTGDWGKEGRLGVLHEKELVLNADDTKNMLLTVSLIRNIVKGIEARALFSQFANLPDSSSYSNHSIGNNSIDQNVRIEASFPGVTDRYEIEEALNNLVNTASQYAYR